MGTFKKFVGYYKPYKDMFFYDMACAAAVSAVDLSIPLMINHVLKNVFTLQNSGALMKTVLLVALAFLGLYIIRAFAQYYVSSWGHIMGAKMETDMRRDLFSHMEKLSFSYYDKNNTGHMMSRIVSDLFDISELAHHGPEDVFISVLKLSGSFTILMMINAQITLTLFAITIFMLVFVMYFNKKMKAVFMDNRKKIADVNAVVRDSLSGIRVVQSFSNEEIEREKFERGNMLFLASKKNSYFTMGQYFAVNGFMQGLMYLAVIVAGGIFAASGKIQGTDVIVYILYIGMFLDPINRLVNFTEQFQKGFSGFKRMLEVLEIEPDIVEKKGAADIALAGGEITFKDVGFAYDKAQVLSGINAVIPSGRTVALVGPSGAGKSTFCSLIPRFYDVTKGKITIDGQDIRDVTLSSLRKSVGVVQQDVYIFSSSVRDNIAYGKPDATESEVINAAKLADIHDVIMELPDGYDTYLGEQGVQFSGGQKQRLSIARVFLKNPPILILDEATSSLDNESERIIQGSLERLSKGRTTIVIAHRLSTVRKADEILVLTDEGIIQRGAHEKLMEEGGLYKKLYDMQFEDGAQ